MNERVFIFYLSFRLLVILMELNVMVYIILRIKCWYILKYCDLFGDEENSF